MRTNEFWGMLKSGHMFLVSGLNFLCHVECNEGKVAMVTWGHTDRFNHHGNDNGGRFRRALMMRELC